MKRLITLLAAASLAAPTFGQAHNLIATDFGGASVDPMGGGPGPGAGWSVGSKAPGSGVSIDLNGDGHPENVDFTDPNGAILGLSGVGGFTPLDHDPVATLTAFDADGDGWLDTTEMNAAGLSLHGSAGETMASTEIADLLIGLLDYENSLCLGGYRANGEIFGSVLTIATETAGTVVVSAVSTPLVVTADADPAWGNCAFKKHIARGSDCAPQGVACVRDGHDGICETQVHRVGGGANPEVAVCVCETGEPVNLGLLDARLLLALSVLLVLGATTLTLRADAAA